MISLHTAHLDKLENDLINFRKMAQLSVIFQNLTDLQNSMPPVQENRDLIKLLQVSEFIIINFLFCFFVSSLLNNLVVIGYDLF